MIGVIADDFTGATDCAVAFRRAGLRTVILFHADDATTLPDNDVTVIALKTRTIDPVDAVDQSLAALARLRAHGATQIFFKYCSTFDSHGRGNIGPVADALHAALGASRTVFVPAAPEHQRTQYMGHLFVGRTLLAESPMRYHPLTPMTESYLPRVLAAQTPRGVTLIDHSDVRLGSNRIRAALTRSESEDSPYVFVDAVSAADLDAIAGACYDDVLVTGAAGLAGALGAEYARRTRIRPETVVRQHPSPVEHPGVVLAGSCSRRTLEQIDHMKRRGHPSFRLDAVCTPDSGVLAEQALDWFDRQPAGTGPLVYSSLPPHELGHVQQTLGRERSSEILEAAMGRVARGLVERGVRTLVVAGGETSGAVVSALRIQGGIIGEEAAPGVPWILTGGRPELALLLKSGNFGDRELLSDAVMGKR